MPKRKACLYRLSSSLSQVNAGNPYRQTYRLTHGNRGFSRKARTEKPS